MVCSPIPSYKLRLVTILSIASEWAVVCDSIALNEWTKSNRCQLDSLVKRNNTYEVKK